MAALHLRSWLINLNFILRGWLIKSFAPPSPHPEEVRSTVSKDEGVSSACWMLLRDATSWLLRMREEIYEPASQDEGSGVESLYDSDFQEGCRRISPQ